jgi:Flp pilus assembly protein TadG
MRLLAQYIRSNRGQTIVEFALILPVFTLLIAGMMEFGLIINQYLVVAEAAREGARSAALGGTDAQVTTVVDNAASTINQGNLTVTISPETRVSGNSVTVTVTNPIQTITPLISPFFPAGSTVQGTAVMRVE